MAQNGQEDVPRAIDLLGIGRRGLCQRFINRFVKANHVVKVVLVGALDAFYPQANDAGSQVAKL